MNENEKDYYTNPICMTQQFRFCGNAFRVDLYKGCDFGCKYCFANSSLVGTHKNKGLCVDFTQIETLFKRAFDDNDETDNLNIELLRHRVPLHCGGMSDPFQQKEFEYKLTYKLIQLSNKYKYPISFSTKQCDLPDEYFKILNPSLHAFQVSIMGWDDEFIKKYESNTPTAKQRLNFVKKLRDKGFWCSIRIQPLVDIEQAKKLIEKASSYPSYITVEHLKIPNDNIKVKALFIDEYNKNKFYKSPMNMRNIEPTPDIKETNIEEIKKIANKNGVKVGVGDNDLHYLSQSRCCCGIDTINKNFDNYLKYNLTYFITGDCDNIDDLWTPCGNCNSCVFSASRIPHKQRNNYKDLTNEYIEKNDWLVYKANKPDVMKKLFGIVKNRLF